MMITAKGYIDLKIVHIASKDNAIANHMSGLCLGAQHLIALQLLIPTHMCVAIPEGAMKVDWSI